MRTTAARFLLFGLLLFAACGQSSDNSTDTTSIETGQPQFSAVPTSVVEFSVLDLSEPVGCQVGFRVRNSTETLGLIVNLQLVSNTNAPSEGKTVFDIAEDEASGAVLFGENLFYQLCDDVIEADEPEEKIDERWELVEGQITLAKVIPSDESGGGGVGSVTASASGLVAQKPNGDRVEVGSIELVNTNWAFFGG